MRSTIAILPALLAPVAQALSIPRGSTEGSYMVTLDERGEEVHVKLPEIASSPVEKRQTSVVTVSTDYHCGCGLEMNHADTDAAVEALKNQLRRAGDSVVVAKGLAWYEIRGTTVAFLCQSNRGAPSSTFMSSTILRDILANITKYCGWYVPGTFDRPTNSNTDGYIKVGYMNYDSETKTDFCGLASSSPLQQC